MCPNQEGMEPGVPALTPPFTGTRRRVCSCAPEAACSHGWSVILRLHMDSVLTFLSPPFNHGSWFFLMGLSI